uniref:RING-type E3 ubiquitin transferase n=1 Tax=Globisporangium ultimum (strain ATCC 200006 / CBS 805.95 / DAOM BR144) TaxID=431595 RepID=K3W5M7_GLOUD
MDRDGRVFMIVRTNSPRNANGAGGNGGDGALGLSMAAMEADWRQQQFQRQRMQLLSMAIFLCFMVLFFDNRAGDPQRRNRMGESGAGTMGGGNGYNRYALPHEMFNDTERVLKVHELEALLQQQPGYMKDQSPMNVSGIYSGTWESLAPEDYDAQKPVYTDIIPYLKVDREIQLQQYTQPVETGHTWLFLKMKSPASKELKKEVAYVTGQLVIYEEQASLAATILPVQGVFLRRLGKLTLFGNSPDSSVQLLYRKRKVDDNSTIAAPDAATESSQESDLDLLEEQPLNQATLDPRLDIMNFGIIDGVPVLENKDDYAAIDISPPRYAYVSRFRSGDSFSDQCVSIVEMSLANATEAASFAPKEGEEDDDDEKLANALKNMRLTGTLASVNCGLYLKIDTTFQEENLNVFFSKASRYAVIMTLIAMGEIYFLLRQLQVSNTQATAAKVSLLTIGQQAIVDSYLCLGHLTVGIVAQNVFAAFASVAFVKLIIFSVFEMRYLLIIWKARRPQGFSEGWLTLRRELTTLYSRFYLSLLAGLCFFYNFSNHLPILVFLCYSFWVPQIVHNAHREVRNPFDLGYLYGISALRMFLPLYFYGCPNNFLTAFPMLPSFLLICQYESKPNPQFCYILVLWMGFQVGVLTLQQRFGPRFFVPARFLPVKYNYERRINLQEMTLLKSSTNDEDNTIDCVICMVELDIEARDYMIAPCEHIFHRECLQGWMQVKMECPTCRCVLPEP